MKFLRIILVSSLSTMAFMACQKEEVLFEETKTAIIEGYLHGGKTIDSLRVTQSFSYTQTDTNIIALEALEIRITTDSSEFFLESSGNGYYFNTQHVLKFGGNYAIEFHWQEEIISSETYIPIQREATLSVTEIELDQIELGTFGGGGTMVDPVEITWDNVESDYYYVHIENLEENPEYVNENIAQFQEENGEAGRFNFTSEPNITDFYAIDPRRELTQFGTHQIIVFRVNAEYAALYESSGNSTQSLEEPPSNIVNGLGIFTGVSSDTLYLEVKKI